MYMITDCLTCRPQKKAPPERGAGAALVPRRSIQRSTKEPATPRVENVADYTAADLAVSGDTTVHGLRRGRLYRQPARSEASRWPRHRTRSRPQDSAIYITRRWPAQERPRQKRGLQRGHSWGLVRFWSVVGPQTSFNPSDRSRKWILHKKDPDRSRGQSQGSDGRRCGLPPRPGYLTFRPAPARPGR